MTTLRYWASARAAAGTDHDDVDAATLADALEQVRERRGERLAHVLTVCSFVVDGEPVGSREHARVRLDDAALVDVLPPFAGG